MEVVTGGRCWCSENHLVVLTSPLGKRDETPEPAVVGKTLVGPCCQPQMCCHIPVVLLAVMEEPLPLFRQWAPRVVRETEGQNQLEEVGIEEEGED